jgi:hypothetical protein
MCSFIEIPSAVSEVKAMAVLPLAMFKEASQHTIKPLQQMGHRDIYKCVKYARLFGLVGISITA